MAIEITELKKRATMINDKVRMYLLPPLFNAAVRAGASIMNIYKNLDDYDISLKDDKTPITLADRLAHKTIREYLGRTRIPILSEEGREMRYDERRNWELYWLVDPLDGTVEFIKGNNEFTVNIALMENNVCMGAVIYVPYFEKMYVAGRDSGSYVKEHIAPDAAAEYTYDQIVTGWRQLPLEEGAERVAVSRSHQTPETAEHIARLREAHPDLEIVEQGSSYKFCLLAEGKVDYYVRTTHTYEWDTAAGELILAEAGGRPHAARRPGTALQRGGPAQSVVRLPVETLQDLTEAVPNRFRDIRRRGRPRVGQPHFLFAGESASAGFGQLLPANLSLPTSACYSPPTSFSPSNYCQLSPLDHIRWTPVWPDGRRVTPPAPRQGIP